MNIIFTGSRVYGEAKEDSDIDIVVTNSDLPKLLLQLDELGVQIRPVSDNPAYAGFYFSTKDLPPVEVNIIVAEDEDEYEVWRQATNCMCKIPVIKDREKRVEQFHSFQTAARNEMYCIKSLPRKEEVKE